MNWSDYARKTLKKSIDENSPAGGVQVIDENGKKPPFYILYKIWPSETQVDGRRKTVVIYFDKEDFDNEIIRNANEDNREYGVAMGDNGVENVGPEEAIWDTYQFITRNYSGYYDTTFDKIDEGLLKDFFDDDNVKRRLAKNLDFVGVENASKSEKDFFKDVGNPKTTAQGAAALGASKFTKKMVQEFGLKPPVKFDYKVWKSGGWGCTYFFEEGFNFNWNRDSYGRFDFEISRNNPNSIASMKTNGFKCWGMKRGPAHFDIKNYSYYRDFAERVLDRVRGNWKISLDMEE